MMSSATWDGQDQHMAAASEDEFNQFLDMSGMANIPDGMHFDFQGFQDGGAAAQSLMAHQREPADALMADSESSSMIPRTSALMQNQTPPISSAGHNSVPAHMMPDPGSSDISSIDAQIQYLQQQKFHQQQRQIHEQRAAFFSNNTNHGGHSVPPTPQSLEMPPGSGQFYSQAEQISHSGAFDRSYQQQLRDQQEMAFTPLVSPAVTPLDPHFNMENAFTVPGAYFSPLTSPALHAQNDSSSTYDHSTHSNNSPVEMDLEAPPQAPPAANVDLAKKARKNNAAKARATKPGVKSSPISKPQRRKTGPSPAIVSQVLSEVEERNAPAGESALLPLPAPSTEITEENASVSPENLTDMPPPPVPSRRSTSKSPYIQAQNGNTKAPANAGGEEVQPHPATPASLMKLPASKRPISSHRQDNTATDNIESLELPESVSSRPLAPIKSRGASESPRIELNSFKASTAHPLRSPVTRPSGTVSANQSPQLRPGSSGPSARKTPQLASRGDRKRSTGSVHASPALLPRISPNIKPLLPGTPGMSSADDAASRLLMSKSNYQNIIEGNTVPGVSYPSELSTNLTSKRTSHKIAEQGRRNRINSALQIMAGLLPEHHRVPSAEDGDKKDGKPPSAANAANSKASVVENAIMHMQTLEQENVELKQELQELKKKLQEMEGLAAG